MAVGFDMNTLDDVAAYAHEVYLAYVKAGFTPDQAMELLFHHLRLSDENSRLDERHGQT